MKLAPKVCLAFILTVFAADVARAQPAPAGPQVSVGYQLLHIPDETFPLGFMVDAAGQVADGWTIAGEFGWARDDQNEFGIDGSLTFIDYGIGPRWNFAGRTAQPFAQVLLGGVHTSASLTSIEGQSIDDSDNAFMLQPGAGVFVPLGASWGVVGQGDYRHVFFKEEGDDEFRLFVGIRFGR